MLQLSLTLECMSKGDYLLVFLGLPMVISSHKLNKYTLAITGYICDSIFRVIISAGNDGT